jgi:L-threonylcarbamoyladenylate synthase
MSENPLSSAIQALQQAKLIAYPTEAVYGLGCDPLQQSAVFKFLQLKKRAGAKGLILIAANRQQIMPYIDISQLPAHRLQQIFATWPGPVTWLFPATSKVPDWIRGAYDTIAVRVTAHPIANALCAAFGRPLVSTSANLTGQLPADNALAVQTIFPEGIAVVVPGEVGGLEKPTEIRDANSGAIVRA